MVQPLNPQTNLHRPKPAEPVGSKPLKPAFSRAPSTARADAPENDGYSIHQSNVHPAMHAMRNRPHFKAKDLALATAAVDNILKSHGIAHRFGGSMAAALYGGKRDPGDVDVEVATDQDAQRALAVLSRLNDDVKTASGTVHVQSKFVLDHSGAGGQVRLKLTHPSGKVVEVDVDVLNENHPNMIGGLRSPGTRGVAIDPRVPNFLKPHDLIANYLDRLVSRPAYAHAKQDPLQIMSILRKIGFDPHNAEHVDALFTALRARAKTGLGEQYVNEMNKIIDIMERIDHKGQA